MKINCCLLLLTSYYTLAATSKSKNKSKSPGILVRGWFKYINVIPSNDSQDFETNNDFEYENMRISKAAAEMTDDVGKIDIPDKHSFYMVLTTTTLNILTSRRNQITKTADVIDIKGLNKISQFINNKNELQYKGGMEVLGKFDEGKCIKLNLRSGASYIVCSTNESKMLDMVNYIFDIWKSKLTKKTDYEENAEFSANFSIDDKNFDLEKYIKEEQEGKQHPNEFVDIGDWSVCDHVCGGGLQTKLKGCTPPVGGFKCERHVLKRSCNTQPCKKGQSSKNPEAEADEWKKKQPTITLPIKLESRYVSHRFQQYEECRIKDEDLCIRRQDLVWKLGLKAAPVLPGRGVLNRNTFSFYENTKYDSLHRSFLLEDIVVKPFALDTNCFEVKSKYDQVDSLTLCGCPFEPSSKDSAINWIKEIVKFRDNCAKVDNKAINISDNDHLALKFGNEQIDVSGDKLKQLAKSSLEEKMKQNEKDEDDKESQKISDAINQVESITTNYTKNEFFKERLIEKEEELKAKKELENLDKMIQKEKEKEKCIETFLERESRRQSRKSKEKQAEQELQEIKGEVERQVKNIKHVFRTKMGRLRQETERIKMEKMKQLTNMKLKITSMLIDQEIKGSIGNCKQDKEENKVAYCNARFPTTWFENKFCRVKQNFCGVCCEKEFSVRFSDDREKCLYECRLANGMINTSSGAEKTGGTNESATVEIINNP